jgi:hypothetical protein
MASPAKRPKTLKFRPQPHRKRKPPGARAASTQGPRHAAISYMPLIWHKAATAFPARLFVIVDQAPVVAGARVSPVRRNTFLYKYQLVNSHFKR